MSAAMVPHRVIANKNHFKVEGFASIAKCIAALAPAIVPTLKIRPGRNSTNPWAMKTARANDVKAHTQSILSALVRTRS